MPFIFSKEQGVKKVGVSCKVITERKLMFEFYRQIKKN